MYIQFWRAYLYFFVVVFDLQHYPYFSLHFKEITTKNSSSLSIIVLFDYNQLVVRKIHSRIDKV